VTVIGLSFEDRAKILGVVDAASLASLWRLGILAAGQCRGCDGWTTVCR
jgi:hypothetical protein